MYHSDKPYNTDHMMLQTLHTAPCRSLPAAPQQTHFPPPLHPLPDPASRSRLNLPDSGCLPGICRNIDQIRPHSCHPASIRSLQCLIIRSRTAPSGPGSKYCSLPEEGGQMRLLNDPLYPEFRIRQRTVRIPPGFGSAGRLTFRALYPICFRRFSCSSF